MAPTTSPTSPADFMVKIEMEAAEVLAGLAGDSSRNRPEEVSCGDDYKVSDANSPEIFTCADQDCKQDAVLKLTPDSATTSKTSPSCSKSRQNLTEELLQAEKESKRLRRVLANRESARQTIRRRQAIFDELTKKAADLAIENDKLKMVKELAEKEYDSSKITNDRLKVEMREMANSEQEETIQVESNPSTSSNNFPAFIYNNPSFLQYNPQTPFYLVPYPWIFPIHNQENRNLQNVENEPSTSLNSNKNQERCFGFPPDGGGVRPSGTILGPSDNQDELRMEDNRILGESINVLNDFETIDVRKRRKQVKNFKNVKCK